MGPTSNDWCLYKEGEEHRDTQREETVKAEAEMGVTALQTKEATSCQEPPEQGWMDCSLEPSKAAWPC